MATSDGNPFAGSICNTFRHFANRAPAAYASAARFRKVSIPSVVYGVLELVRVLVTAHRNNEKQKEETKPKKMNKYKFHNGREKEHGSNKRFQISMIR